MNTAARNDKDVEAPQQSAEPAAPAQPDNGLTPEENALLFKEEPAPAAGQQQPPADQQQGGQQQQPDPNAQQQAGQQQVDPSQQGGAQAQPGQQAGAEEDEDAIDDDGTPKLGPDGQPKPPPRRVNYNKYDRALKRAQKAEADLKKLGEEVNAGKVSQARLEERLTLINEALMGKQGAAAQQQQQQQNDPEPDPADIFEHTAWMKRRLVETQEALQQMQQGQRAMTESEQLVSSYQTDAATFAQREPLFPAAYEFLLASRAVELGQLMFGKDFSTTQPTMQELNELKAAIGREEKGLVETAIKQGRSPAAALFTLAKGRGFDQYVAAQRAHQQGQQQQQQPQQQPNGQQQPAQQQQPGQQQVAAPGLQPGQQGGTPSVTERLAQIRSGQDASQSLSQGVSGGGGTMLTPERLANMSPAEFEAFYSKLSPLQKQQALGGA